MKVVDASVALKWFVAEDGAAAAERLLAEDLVAPILILSEVANGLWKKRRRREISPEQALAALASLPGLLARLYPVEALIGPATELALDIDHPVYDCIYIALADRLGVPFVTADLKLTRAASSTRYAELIEMLA